MKKKLKTLTFLLAVILWEGVTTHAVASPIFGIGDGRSTNWTQGINDGNVQPISGAVAQAVLEDFLQTQTGADAVEGKNPVLTPDIFAPDDNNVEFESLVMSWDPPSQTGPNDVSVAGWEYVYDVDPDLNGTIIDFSLDAPPGIWDVVLALRDEVGLRRKWGMSMPPIVWTNLSINPAIAGPQGAFPHFMEDAGFDLTKVIAIELYEAGMPVGVVDPSGANLGVWNAWNHLEVRDRALPEPTTLTFAALGLLSLGMTRRRRRR